MRHRLHERELLAHPVRVGLGLVVLVLGEVEVVEKLGERAVPSTFSSIP